MHKIKSFMMTLAIGITTLGLSIPSAQAIVIWSADGSLAQNVNVNGTLYDVAFGDGSCLDLFAPCNTTGTFAFNTEQDALAATYALQSQAFLDSAVGNFGTDPTTINGCGPDRNNGDACAIHVPFGTLVTGVRAMWVLNGGLEGINDCGPQFFIPFPDCVVTTPSIILNTVTFEGGFGQNTWAVFAPSAVPLPAALPLFLSALTSLGGLGFMKQRRKIQNRLIGSE